MATGWQVEKLGNHQELHWKLNKGVEVWALPAILKLLQMKTLHQAIREDNWEQEVAAKRAGVFRRGTKVMTLGAVEKMLAEFYVKVTKLSRHRLADHWPELSLILGLHEWVVARIELSPTPSYDFKLGPHTFPIRTIPNVLGEPQWVAEDVFRALGNKWNGINSLCQIPKEFRPEELLSPSPNGRRSLCLSWPGLQMVLAKTRKPAVQAFKDDLRERFSLTFPILFQSEFQ